MSQIVGIKTRVITIAGDAGRSINLNICIICPVRNGVPEEVLDYVQLLESAGNHVHLPSRDNPQDDPVGIIICETMRKAIKEADEIHIYYDKNSQGSHFDLGMAFMAEKKMKFINDPEDTEGKSYIKVIKYANY